MSFKEQFRLETLQESANKQRSGAVKKFEVAQDTASDRRDKFFERLALFCLSTVALSITFVANAHMTFSRFGLLRVSWICLLSSVACSAAREWQHTHYNLAVYSTAYLEAEAKTESAKQEIYLHTPGPIVETETGDPVNRHQAAAQAEARAEKFKSTAKDRKELRNTLFKSVRIQERAALLLAFAGMLVLCTWASFNFPE